MSGPQDARVISVESETDTIGTSLWTIKVVKMPAYMRPAEAEPIAGDVPTAVLEALAAWSRR